MVVYCNIVATIANRKNMRKQPPSSHTGASSKNSTAVPHTNMKPQRLSTDIPTSSNSSHTGNETEHGKSMRQENYLLDGNVSIVRQIDLKQDVLCLSYTETFEFLTAGMTDGSIKVFKVNSGEECMTLLDAEITQSPAPTTAIKHRPVHKGHPITQTIIATYVNGCVKCWHYQSAQCIYTIREKRQTLGFAYHPHLPKFVTVGDDAQLYLYDEETKTQERVFRGSDSPEVMDGHKSRVFSACFNPKSAHELISSGWDDTVQFWDIRQPYALRHISGVHMCGDGLDVSKNGKEVLTCAWRKKDSIQLWDYASGRLIVTLEPDSYASQLYCGKYVNNLFIACGGAGTNLFRVVDLRSHASTATIKNLNSGVYGMSIGPMVLKNAKKLKVSEGSRLPTFAFCAGKSIYEVDVQPG